MADRLSLEADPCSGDNAVKDGIGVVVVKEASRAIIDVAESDEKEVTVGNNASETNLDQDDPEEANGVSVRMSTEIPNEKLESCDGQEGKSNVFDDALTAVECKNGDEKEVEEAKDVIKEQIQIDSFYSLDDIEMDDIEVDEYLYGCQHCPGAKFTDIGFDHHLQLHEQRWGGNLPQWGIVQPQAWGGQQPSWETPQSQQPSGFNQPSWGTPPSQPRVFQQPLWGTPPSQPRGFQQHAWGTPQSQPWGCQQSWGNPQSQSWIKPQSSWRDMQTPRLNQLSQRQHQQEPEVITIQDDSPDPEIEDSNNTDDDVQVLTDDPLV